MRKPSFDKTFLIITSIVLGAIAGSYGSWAFVFLFSLVLAFFVFEKFEQALLLLVFYLPFQIAMNLAPGIDMASGRFLILYFFFIWLLRSLKNKKIVINFSLQTILISLFLFIATISVLYSFETERAIRKLLVFYSIFPLYFIITSFVGDKKFISEILNFLFCGLLLVSLIGVLQFSGQFLFGIDATISLLSIYIAPLFYGNTFGAEVVSNPSWLVNISGATIMRAFSVFPDPHIFSFYMGLLIPIFFSLLFTKDFIGIFSQNRFIVYIVFLLTICVELLSFSRGGYLGMVASFSVMILLIWKRFSERQKVSLFFFGALFSLMIFFANSSILSRFVSIFNPQEGSNSERIKNWSQGYDIFSDNLFFGVGIGNYSYNLDPVLEYRDPVYAHNLYLDLGAEMGIFSVILWLLLFGITFWQLLCVSQKDNNNLNYIAVGLAGSLVWFSVHAFFDTPIYSPQILSVLITIIAISVLVVRHDKIKIE